MENDGRIFLNNNNFFHNQFMIPLGRILQVSELSVIRGGEINAHKQVCEEITYVISGSAEFYCNDKCVKVKEGQIHFIGSGNVHRIVVSQDSNLRYICIGIQLNREEECVENFLKTVQNSPHLVMEDNGIVKGLSEYLIREFYSWDEMSNTMINSYIYQILMTLSRIISGNVISYKKKDSEKSASYAMYQLLRYLDREYMQIKNVGSIADMLSYSEYYLSHLFKRKMGITIKEYLTQKKVVHAMELLTTTEMSVEKIADSLGFSTAHSFRRVFKQCTGLSPSEYKEKNQDTELT